jgi:hypothetical protein
VCLICPETDRHGITEILLKVSLNTIKHTNKQTKYELVYTPRGDTPTPRGDGDTPTPRGDTPTHKMKLYEL